jgi:uncharacterized protein YegJ (DUF2314 family)
MSAGKIILLLFAVLIMAVIATKPGGSVLNSAATDGVVYMPDSDPAMQSARAKAQATLEEFLVLAQSPPPNTTSFALKFGVSDGGNTEYFWIDPFTVNGSWITGRLANSPEVVSNVSLGEEVRFRRSEVVDWTYTNTNEGRMYGNFTSCALLSRESAAESAAFRKEYGLICED